MCEWLRHCLYCITYVSSRVGGCGGAEVGDTVVGLGGGYFRSVTLQFNVTDSWT